MSLQGKVVAITGASAGIGRATAREMARRGAHVGLIARGAERLEAARARGAASWACAPASRRPTWPTPSRSSAAAAQIEAELGPIDVWVNNAMAAELAPVADTRPRSSAASPRSPTSAASTARRPRCGACARATAA